MRVLVTTPWSEAHLKAVRDAFPAVEFVQVLDPEGQVQAIAEADAVFGQLSRDAFRAARKLRWIQSQSAGVEWTANVPELRGSQVVVTNTRGAHGTTIAEHTFGMLIALARGFPQLWEAQKAHRWERPVGRRHVGLAGLTLGVIGLGNIGRAIANLGSGFGMTVLAVDVNDVDQPASVAELGRLDRLPDLLRRSDVVVVTVPYTAQTRGMLGASELALMKSSAFLLVVSRGGLIDEDALVRMLREGRLAGAGLDVQAQEPLPPDSPLWDAPNLFLTPHCSALSEQTIQIATDIFRENLRRFIAGEPLTNVCDVGRGY